MREARPPALASGLAGRLEEARLPSPALGRDLHYLAYLPAGYTAAGRRYPLLLLLHGRGGHMEDWARIAPDLDDLIAAGWLPPLVAIAPDDPGPDRAGYWVDSAYTGLALETACVADLLPHAAARFYTHTTRAGRAVAGYSMGGYGALRYALVYPELFSAAIVLSPAVYVPEPPAGSSTRAFGAFGRGGEPFDPARYAALNYPALVDSFTARGLGLRLFLAAGDGEYRHPDPAEAEHDLDFETHRVFNRLARVPGVHASLRVLGGGHGWDVWTPAFREGAAAVLGALTPPE